MAFLTAILKYTVDPGLQPPLALAAKVAGVALYRGELDGLGLEVITDATAPVGSSVVREITLITTPQGQSMWQTPEELASALRNLYTSTLALCVPAPVTAEEPDVGI